MLFSNPLAAQSEAAIPPLHQLADQGFTQAEVVLPSSRRDRENLKDLLQVTGIRPIAFRAPAHLGLGTAAPLNKEEWTGWMEAIAPLFRGKHRYLICHGATVTLGEVFEYLDARPRDFNALHDYKTQYVEQMIEQLGQLEEAAQPFGIHLLVENAPMGGPEYFEPGKNWIHPALRTPRHLLRITEATGVKLCFDTAHARITSNVFTYMHRSRSLFAASTEKEILNATRSWIQFYEQVKERTAIVRLSYSVSWGDTPDTCHIPFPEAAYAELLDFAEQIPSKTPIVLPSGAREETLPALKSALHRLKKR
ncbi:TIM barrel protein [Salinithrix halophila]|uniref:TIM barrel protein n=1 Tax=Salinithrix halophila TaxID=1485204 RepID=A0ABV8JIV6_9BACL